MDKPSNFKYPFTLARDEPYEVRGDGIKGPHCAKGLLYTGRVVWLDHPLGESGTDKHIAMCFAEGIGLVEVESSALAEVKPKHF